MNSNQYKALALRTESRVSEINFGEVALHINLTAMIKAAELANQIKRAIFYGKAIDPQSFGQAAYDLMQIAQLISELPHKMQEKNDRQLYDALPPEAQNVDVSHLDSRTLHAALGIFSEAGEVLEIIKKQLETGEFDKVNWGEELGGDISWYQAIGHDAAGTSEELERIKNIEKLAARYPAGFNDAQALCRNLQAERAILESTPQIEYLVPAGDDQSKQQKGANNG